MRESEFCTPGNNKAVISITPNWYDRRALDTRSNYALYSSLSHLANLCQTSPKVRESLACDGGMEQLVRILRQGKICRTPEMFQLSKWQQSLLCIVNVGVRGSEGIRNRVIEAGIVPITVTILCNALEQFVQCYRIVASPSLSSSRLSDEETVHRTDAFMNSIATSRLQMRHSRFDDVSSRIEHDTLSDDLGRPQAERSTTVIRTPRPRVITNPQEERQMSSRQADRYSAMIDGILPRSTTNLGQARAVSRVFDHQFVHNDTIVQRSELHQEDRTHPISSPRDHEMHDQRLSTTGIATSPASSVDLHNFQPARSRSQSGTIVSFPRHTPGSVEHSRVNDVNSGTDTTVRTTTWDQDVTLCLKLLAYLSKYPYLRPEFSKSHDVPQLRQNLKQFEMHYNTNAVGVFDQMDEDLSESLQIPSNVFSLVEKFTMRIHVSESTYWAGVIMRNSCRRHEQGGVRQCAYLECGKWETQNRQFAKCRRCRRTKYCSKACQSKAWTGHRYWCSSSTPPVDTSS